MKGYLYGREDAAQQKRGYKIFEYDLDIDRETIVKLRDFFSTTDPSGATLQNLGSFYFYFRVTDTYWTVAKGGVESRGDYYSFIVHGLLLEEYELKAINYNPFVLGELLTTKIGDRRNVLPEMDLTQIESLSKIEDLPVEDIKAICQQENGENILLAMGDLVNRILAEPEPLPSKTNHTYCSFAYEQFRELATLKLLFQLLPESYRRSTSIATFGPFIELKLNLAGQLLELDHEAENTLDIDPQKPKRTILGDILSKLTDDNLSTIATLALKMWHATRGDIDSGFLIGTQAGNILNNHMKVMLRRGPMAIESMKSIHAGVRIYELIAAYLEDLGRRIWFKSYPDREFLLEGILNAIIAVEKQVNNDLHTQAEVKTKEVRQNVKENLLKMMQKDSLLPMLGSGLIEYYNPSQDNTLCNKLWRLGSSDLDRFGIYLASRVRVKPYWSDTLNRLCYHPNFYHQPPKMLASYLKYALTSGANTTPFLYQILDKRFTSDKAGFIQFFQRLKDNRAFVFRIHKVLCDYMIECIYTSFYKRNEAFSLIKTVFKNFPTQFESAAYQWIHFPRIELTFETFMQDPELSMFLRKIWHPSHYVSQNKKLYYSDIMYTKYVFFIANQCSSLEDSVKTMDEFMKFGDARVFIDSLYRVDIG